MTATTTEATSYQAAWDERAKKHKRFSRTVNYGFLALFIVMAAWFGTEIFERFTILNSAADAAAKHVATRDFGALAGGFMFASILLAMISGPCIRAVGWSEWALGERPADDYKPREPKRIDVRVEQVDENTRIFHIPGLYRPEGFAFKVARIADKRRFRAAEYSYQITSASEKNWIHTTLGSSLFKGSSEEEINQYIVNHISTYLEDKTDYFKELNYAI